MELFVFIGDEVGVFDFELCSIYVGGDLRGQGVLDEVDGVWSVLQDFFGDGVVLVLVGALCRHEDFFSAEVAE